MVPLPLALLFLLLGISTAVASLLFSRSKTKDLEERNKRLAALRKLDQVMISSSRRVLDVAQEVTNDIATDLGFEVGVLALVDKQKGVLKRVAMSNTRSGVQAKKTLSFPYEKLEIPLGCEQNLAIQALKTNQRKVTHDLYDVFMPVLDKQLSEKLQETVAVKTSFVYPVRARGEAIGVMIISIGRMENQLSAYEMESIENLVDVIGIALENAILYQNLQETSQKLAVANKRLEELDKLKDDFVSVASHELRTPMTAIRSYSWMALNRPDIELSEKMKKYLSRVLISTERLINLVNDMLNVSRIEAGRIEIKPQIFEIPTLVDDVLAEVTPKANEKMVRLEVVKSAMPKVFADPDKVHQVLLNLIGNSLKFTPVDGLIRVSFLSDGKVVEISVKDNGVGISKDDLSRLFQKFGRLDNSYVAAATSGGTGLGLYISKSLVELMHGDIKASSEGVGKGATFTFSLPIATPEIVAQSDKFSKRPIGEAKPLEPAAI